MKLLFDQNLSPRLVRSLSDLFPGSDHVFLLGLDRAEDDDLWVYARDNGFTIVTKDADFGFLSLLRGWPPKVIWLQLGNCATAEIEAAFQRNLEALERFDKDSGVGILEISGAA